MLDPMCFIITFFYEKDNRKGARETSDATLKETTLHFPVS